jgi:sec-independent protein translocase protein TatB
VLDSIGWGEIVVLLLAALFIFGPERLPTLTKDVATGLRRVRGVMSGVRDQLHDTLGPDFDHLKDVDPSQYHPRNLLRRALAEEAHSPAPGPALQLAAERARVADVPPHSPAGDADGRQ